MTVGLLLTISRLKWIFDRPRAVLLLLHGPIFVRVSGEGVTLMIYDERHPLYTKHYRKALMFCESTLRISICYCTSHLLSIQTEAVVPIPLSPFASASELHHEDTRPGISLLWRPWDTILNPFRTQEARSFRSSCSESEIVHANCKSWSKLAIVLQD